MKKILIFFITFIFINISAYASQNLEWKTVKIIADYSLAIPENYQLLPIKQTISQDYKYIVESQRIYPSDLEKSATNLPLLLLTYRGVLNKQMPLSQEEQAKNILNSIEQNLKSPNSTKDQPSKATIKKIGDNFVVHYYITFMPKEAQSELTMKNHFYLLPVKTGYFEFNFISKNDDIQFMEKIIASLNENNDTFKSLLALDKLTIQLPETYEQSLKEKTRYKVLFNSKNASIEEYPTVKIINSKTTTKDLQSAIELLKTYQKSEEQYFNMLNITCLLDNPVVISSENNNLLILTRITLLSAKNKNPFAREDIYLIITPKDTYQIYFLYHKDIFIKSKKIQDKFFDTSKE